MELHRVAQGWESLHLRLEEVGVEDRTRIGVWLERRQVNVTTLNRVSPLCDSIVYRQAHIIDLPSMPQVPP